MIPNQALIAGLSASFSAQLIKFATTLVAKRKIDFRTLTTTGGMPSSHTALVAGLTTSVALLSGLHSRLFDVSLVFSLIVMYDAAGVRRAAGKQARILNQIMEEFQESLTFHEEHLKELLGHTPVEVLGGAAWGILVAFLFKVFA